MIIGNYPLKLVEREGKVCCYGWFLISLKTNKRIDLFKYHLLRFYNLNIEAPGDVAK